MKYVLTAIFFLLLLSITFAQIVLPPVNVPFTILPMVLSLCQDFSGTKQFLCLDGDLSYIAAKWDVRYPDNSERNVGVRCYFNCANPLNDIDTNCATSPKCEYLGLVGAHSCVILNPNYKFSLPPSEVNNVTCKFYDPTDPSLDFRPYPNRTFRPIDSSLSIAPVTANVGDQFNFPLTVTSLGLIPSSYTFNITELSQPSALLIDRNIGSTEKLAYGQSGRFSPKILYLISRSTNIRVLANANSDPVTCNTDADCSYLGDAKCIIPQSGPNKCWKKVDIQLQSGKASLPDFDIFGFLQIMMISAVVLFLVRRK